MNGKEGLENIRRKAPATRKVVASQPGDDVVPPAQMDLFNSQMVAMQQQLQNLSDRYSELNMQNSILLSELNCMQKTLLNHEQLMQSMLSYVQRADPAIRHSQRLTRANAAFAGNADPASSAAFGMNTSSQNLAVLDAPLSPPLRNAERIFNELAADAVSHQRNLTQLNELYRLANGQLQTAQPESALVPRSASVGSGPPPPVATEAEATLDFVRLNSDLHDTVYPAGHNHGIDPMFSEHIPNIPYSLPPPPPPPAGSLEQAEEVRRPSYVDGRKKSTSADPGWIRPPQILLVEDDPTCRRIGGKFLYSFKCAIDTAVRHPPPLSF
jgi:osomolarity two-component system response regulator SKN7